MLYILKFPTKKPIDIITDFLISNRIDFKLKNNRITINSNYICQFTNKIINNINISENLYCQDKKTYYLVYSYEGTLCEYYLNFNELKEKLIDIFNP